MRNIVLIVVDTLRADHVGCYDNRWIRTPALDRICEEGVRFDWLSAPKGFHGKDSVAKVRAIRMRLGAPDATGRQTPEEQPGSEYDLPGELVIQALGFELGPVGQRDAKPAVTVGHRTDELTRVHLDAVGGEGVGERCAGLDESPEAT